MQQTWDPLTNLCQSVTGDLQLSPQQLTNCIEECEQQLGSLGEEEVAALAWTITKQKTNLLNIMPKERLDAIMQTLAQKLSPNATAQSISAGVWALGEWGASCSDQKLKDICKQLYKIKITSAQVSDIFWGMTKMKFKPFKSTMEDILDQVDVSGVSSSVPLLWALEQMDVRPSNKLLNKICICAEREFPNVSDTAIALLILLCGHWQFKPVPGLLSKVQQHLTSHASLYAASALVNMMCGFANLLYHPGNDCLGNCIVRLSQVLEPQIVHAALHSLAVFSFNPGKNFLQLCAQVIESNLGAFSGDQLCEILWSYAVFESCTKSIWNTLLDQIELLRQKMQQKSLVKLYTVYFLVLNHMNELHTPSTVIIQGWQAWKKELQKSQKKGPSVLTLEMSRILRMLEIEHSNCQQAEDGQFLVDILIKTEEGKLGLMALEGDNLCTNNGMATGSALLAQRLFEANGWVMIPVPVGEWKSVGNQEGKQAYIKSILSPWISD